MAPRELAEPGADDLDALLGGRAPALFVDFDGTLAPIVDDPEAAALPAGTRAALERCAAAVPTAIVSGRDLADLRRRVGIDGLAYAGSHGFEITGPGIDHRIGDEFLPALDAAEAALHAATADLPGAGIERKRYALAVHYRRMDAAAHLDTLRARVGAVAADHAGLRTTEGKKVIELRPVLDWDKGRAVCWLLERWGLDGDDVVPVYVGDDVTDEDAFRALGARGVGVVVDPGRRPTAAGWQVPDRAAVTALLIALAEHVGA